MCVHTLMQKPSPTPADIATVYSRLRENFGDRLILRANHKRLTWSVAVDLTPPDLDALEGRARYADSLLLEFQAWVLNLGLSYEFVAEVLRESQGGWLLQNIPAK